MNIKKIEVFRFSIPMEPFAIATGTMDYAQNTLIRIHTDNGLVGYGECSAFPMIVGETQDTCLVLARDFARIWKGKNAADIPARLAELDLYIAKNATIKSAFDMALHDLAAKHAGLPLYRYLGGERREIETDITIGIGSPLEMASKAMEFVKAGARVLKIKLGKDPVQDVERIRVIREQAGEQIVIRIDANQGWDFDGAVQALRGLEPFGIEFCEQPMRAYNDHLLPALRQQTQIPIMADESCYDHRDASRLILADACDYLNIKFSKSGGIAEALRIHEVAQREGMPCMIGGMLETRLALAANVHFAYAAPQVQFFDMDTCMVGHLADPIIGGIEYNGFQITLPDTPGIGAEVDPSFLADCESWVI
ncbi:MAG TPA: dipeptide epimerase [Sphingobacteriaceae bacterium]|nr:dipeptide epimerase [Sphingobacteriaceae bacterium]